MVLSGLANTKAATKFALTTLMVAGALVQPYRLVVVDGLSMSPTYTDGSLHLAVKPKGNLYRGEVVVLKSPVGVIVKRIQFLPGDRFVQMKMGNSWVFAGTRFTLHSKLGRIKTRIYTMLPDQVYVLGDNRERSVDSSTFGPVPTANILCALVDQKPYGQESMYDYSAND